MNFEIALGSSIDRANQLQIFPPRMEPTAEVDIDEYQFPIHRGDNRYAISLFGAAAKVRHGGQIEQVFTLNLGMPLVIDSILKMKGYFNIQDDDATFLVGLARGLVLVFATRTDNNYAVTYRVVGDASVWRERGYTLPLGALSRQSSREFVLAELSIPAHLLDGVSHD